jgi:hypothetical protein
LLKAFPDTRWSMCRVVIWSLVLLFPIPNIALAQEKDDIKELASSAESMGAFWLWKLTEVV